MPRKTVNVPSPGNAELGRTGLKQTGGYVREDFLPEFTGSRKYKILTEMVDNEPLISGTYFAIRQLIKQVKWCVEPASDSAEDKANAEFVESCLHDMSQSWEDTLDEILSFIVMGFSVHEIVYKIRDGSNNPDSSRRSKYRDGKFGWRKLPIRAQETIDQWGFATDGGVTGCVQRTEDAAAYPVFLPIEKMLLFRTVNYKNNPEGKSIFRASYVPYYYKKRIQSHEAIGIERELNGIPVASIPAKFMHTNASAAERQVFSDYKNLVRNIRSDDQVGMVLPSDTFQNNTSANRMFDVKLLSTQGRRAIDTEVVIGRYNREILITVMADFMLLGHEGVGSYALSSDKTTLFATAVAGFMTQIATVFNKHAIPRLLALNNMKPKELPVLKHGDIEHENVKEFASAMKDLKAAGFQVTDPKLHTEILRRMGFDDTDESGESQMEIVEEPAPVGGSGGGPE